MSLAGLPPCRAGPQGCPSSGLDRGHRPRGPYPERLPWLILAGKFLEEFDLAVDRWAEWATGVVEAWPDDVRGAEPDWAALEEMAGHGDAYVERVAERRRKMTAD